MPPKGKPNGFYMFMLSEQNKIKQKTKVAPSMKDMPKLCIDAWKVLPMEEKKKYEALAKGQKSTVKLDNQRQIISDRQDPAKIEANRRAEESNQMLMSWQNRDVRLLPFHLINFQVMYDERTPEDEHLPVELGLVSFTLKNGIQNELHRFIDPGDVPEGNRRIATEYSEQFHRIPIGYSKGESNFWKLWREMENFLEIEKSDDLAPLFCLSTHREVIENCLEFVHARSGEPNRIYKLYCIEDLIMCLMSKKTSTKPSESQILDTLQMNRWDYTSSIRCAFHEEVDSSFCAISIVKRYSFVIFDLLSNLLEFSLTQNHMPDERKANFTVVSSFGKSREFDKPRRKLSPPPSYAELASQNSSLTSVKSWDAEPKDYKEESDEEEDNGSKTREVFLKELRKPKTPSLIQVAQQDTAPSGLMKSLGRGATVACYEDLRCQIPSGAAPPGLTRAPPGLAMAPPPGLPKAPVGITAAQAGCAIAPPPGFDFKKSYRDTTLLSNNEPQIQAARQMPEFMGRGRGTRPVAPVEAYRGRGRGIPPQIRPSQIGNSNMWE